MRLPWSGKKKDKSGGDLIHCPRCNAPVSSGAPFCDACGARVAPPPSCSLCGTLLEPGSKFCPSCGTMIGSSKEKGHAGEPAGKAVSRKPRAAKPETPEKQGGQEKENGGEIGGKTPAPDSGTPVEDPGAKDEKTDDAPEGGEPPAPVKKAVPPPSRITVPSSGGGWGMLTGKGRNKAVAGILVVLLLAGAALVFTGLLSLPHAPSSPVDTQPTTAPATRPVPTATATSGTGAVAGTNISLVPGPTQTLPTSLDIVLQEERDPRTKMISVEFMGGKGQYGVREIFVRLTRSDGEVLTGSFKPLRVGSRIELQGTEQTDRLEVIVRYYSGAEYTVFDKVFEYKIRTA